VEKIDKFAHDDPSYKLNPELDEDFSRTAYGVEDAIREVILRVNKIAGLAMKRSDLLPKTTTRAYYPSFTLDNQEVEWEAKIESEFKGTKGIWTIRVNVDDPAQQYPETQKNSGGDKRSGPNCPHVGYDFFFLAPGTGSSTSKRTGHIMLRKVHAVRPPNEWRSSEKKPHDRIYDNRFTPERR
jgi:hypothetical protein